VNAWSKKVIRLSAMAVLGAGLIVSVQTALPAGDDSATVPGTGGGMMGGGMMGGGMMGGGMMGGYGPRGGDNGNQEQGSADLNSPAGRLYAQTCARCHALPNPQRHTAEEWPAIVTRMEQRMQQAGQPLPAKDEIQEIDKFLAQRASGR